eukprot:6536230-Prymnesium_polylepis.1
MRHRGAVKVDGDGIETSCVRIKPAARVPSLFALQKCTAGGRAWQGPSRELVVSHGRWVHASTAAAGAIIEVELLLIVLVPAICASGVDGCAKA